MGGGHSGTSQSHPPAEPWNLPTPLMILLRLPAWAGVSPLCRWGTGVSVLQGIRDW